MKHLLSGKSFAFSTDVEDKENEKNNGSDDASRGWFVRGVASDGWNRVRRASRRGSARLSRARIHVGERLLCPEWRFRGGILGAAGGGACDSALRT